MSAYLEIWGVYSRASTNHHFRHYESTMKITWAHGKCELAYQLGCFNNFGRESWGLIPTLWSFNFWGFLWEVSSTSLQCMFSWGEPSQSFDEMYWIKYLEKELKVLQRGCFCKIIGGISKSGLEDIFRALFLVEGHIYFLPRSFIPFGGLSHILY